MSLWRVIRNPLDAAGEVDLRGEQCPAHTGVTSRSGGHHAARVRRCTLADGRDQRAADVTRGWRWGSSSASRRRWPRALLAPAVVATTFAVSAPAGAQRADAVPIVFVHGAAGSGAQYETQARRFESNGYPEDYVRAFEYDSTFVTNSFAQVVERLDAFVDDVREESRGRSGRPRRTLARDVRVQQLPRRSRPGRQDRPLRRHRRVEQRDVRCRQRPSWTAWASGRARTRPATSAGPTCA